MVNCRQAAFASGDGRNVIKLVSIKTERSYERSVFVLATGKKQEKRFVFASATW